MSEAPLADWYTGPQDDLLVRSTLLSLFRKTWLTASDAGRNASLLHIPLLGMGDARAVVMVESGQW